MDRFIELINKIIQPDNFTKFVPIFVSIGGMIPLILKYVDYFKADSFTKQFFFNAVVNAIEKEGETNNKIIFTGTDEKPLYSVK